MEAHFTVYGEPHGKDRARTVRNRYTGTVSSYTPEKTVIYENLVKLSYQQQCRGIFLDGAIEARIIGYFPIPTSTSKKKHRLMAEKKILHTKKIDADNLAKAILDSLNKIAYSDDAKVSKLYVEKYYSETPRVEITLKEIKDDEQTHQN